MRGDQEQQAPMWSDVSPEQRIPQDQPLRPLRALADVVLQERSPGQRRFRRSARRRTVASRRERP